MKSSQYLSDVENLNQAEPSQRGSRKTRENRVKEDIFVTIRQHAATTLLVMYAILIN